MGGAACDLPCRQLYGVENYFRLPKNFLRGKVVHETGEKRDGVIQRLKQSVQGVHLIGLKLGKPKDVIDDYRRGAERRNLFD